MSTTTTLNAKLVATTGRTFGKTIGECHQGEPDHKRRRLDENNHQSNLFYQAQFSSDGTSIITQNADHRLRTFILPPDLLDTHSEPHQLRPHSTVTSPTPIQTYALYPNYNLQDASTTIYLTASNDLPISLNNAVHDGVVHAKYPLINELREEYISPSSLLWTKDGSHFIAGYRNGIAVFDASYDGSGPITTRKTAESRKTISLSGGDPTKQLRGTITALASNGDGILAAGTRERNVAIYAAEGSGDCLTSFSLADEKEYGTGVHQLAWSPNDHYLLVAERQSNGVHVFDLRNTGRRLAFLTGRKANTTARMGMDVLPTGDGGYEVWAGGTDGKVRVWRDAGSVEGVVEADGEAVVHEDPVTGCVWHPQGAVVATCSGRRAWTKSTNPSSSPVSSYSDSSASVSEEDEGDGEQGEKPFDNTLKIWTL